MHLHTLNLLNFRGFASKQLSFHSKFNLLVGDNGCGKTTILDALSIALEIIVYGMNRSFGRFIQPEDSRLTTQLSGKLHEIRFSSPVKITYSYTFLNKQWSAEHIFSGKTLTIQDQDKPSAGKDIKSAALLLREGHEVRLPVIAYFRAHRIAGAQHLARYRELPLKDIPRLQGYDGCLDPMNKESADLLWLDQLTRRAAQDPASSAIFDALSDAANQCIENFNGLYHDPTDGRCLISLTDGRHLPPIALSSGFKSILSIIADIARRAVTLNPYLGQAAIKETPGLVLIDELDLHLHPRWQRKIVGAFKKVFPSIQFIASSHSPFLIQALEPGELINLSQDAGGEYVQASIEDIVERIMGIDLPQLSARKRNLLEVAKRYHHLLKNASDASVDERQRTKEQLNELLLPFGDEASIAFRTILLMERRASGLDQ